MTTITISSDRQKLQDEHRLAKGAHHLEWCATHGAEEHVQFVTIGLGAKAYVV